MGETAARVDAAGRGGEGRRGGGIQGCLNIAWEFQTENDHVWTRRGGEGRRGEEEETRKVYSEVAARCISYGGRTLGTKAFYPFGLQGCSSTRGLFIAPKVCSEVAARCTSYGGHTLGTKASYPFGLQGCTSTRGLFIAPKVSHLLRTPRTSTVIANLPKSITGIADKGEQLSELPPRTNSILVRWWYKLDETARTAVVNGIVGYILMIIQGVVSFLFTLALEVLADLVNESNQSEDIKEENRRLKEKSQQLVQACESLGAEMQYLRQVNKELENKMKKLQSDLLNKIDQVLSENNELKNTVKAYEDSKAEGATSKSTSD